MTKYKDRTPETIKQELKEYNYPGVYQLAKYLDSWMSNEHNDRQFVKLCLGMERDKAQPSEIAKALFGHAYDWFAYGN